MTLLFSAALATLGDLLVGVATVVGAAGGCLLARWALDRWGWREEAKEGGRR
jgi:hypothetical protein